MAAALAMAGDDEGPALAAFQEFVEGVSMSAAYVRSRGQVQLIGVSEQLVGTKWLNAEPFHYAGNIGPIAVSDHLRLQLLHIGEVLGE